MSPSEKFLALQLVVCLPLISLIQVVESSILDRDLFTTVPETQYVYVNDTVTFECGTTCNLTGYTLSFFYGTNAVMATETDLPNGGKRTTFTATSEVNGTDIVCAARMGIMINTTEAAYVYAQGPPNSVSNSTGYQLDSCCMFISWYPPFTLPGLTVQYIISVETDRQYLNDSITSYTYCPMIAMNLTNKQYLFNITTTNEAGIGSTSNITVGFQSNNNLFLKATYRKDEECWVFIYQLKNYQLCDAPIKIVTVKTCSTQNITDCSSFDSVNSTIDNGTLIVTINLPPNMLLTSQVILKYENGQEFLSQSKINISTHDVQDAKITIFGNQVCFQLQFVNGSMTNETHLQFVSSNITHNFTILQNSSLNFTDCVTLPANNWTLYVCDVPPCMLNPAVTLTNISIEEQDNLTSLVFVTVSVTVGPSFNSEDHTELDLGFIVGIAVTIALILLLLTFTCCIVLTLILIKQKKNRTKLNDASNSQAYMVSHELNQTPYNQVLINENEQPTETEMVGNSVALKYIDVEPDPNAPPVPPPFDPVRTVYTEIRPDDGIYNKLHHDFSHTLQVQDNNTGIYSRMNQFTEGVYDKCQHDGNNTKPTRPIATQAQYSTVNVKEATEGQILGQYSLVSVDEITTGINDPISELQVTESVSSQTNTEIPLVKKDLTHKDLSIYVTPYLTEKWREVGLALALTPPQLDDIEENNQGISDVFQLWEDLATRPFTWETLLNALRSSIVNEFNLANQLEHAL